MVGCGNFPQPLQDSVPRLGRAVAQRAAGCEELFELIEGPLVGTVCDQARDGPRDTDRAVRCRLRLVQVVSPEGETDEGRIEAGARSGHGGDGVPEPGPPGRLAPPLRADVDAV